MPPTHHASSRESGQSLTELALAMTMMLILLVGIVDLGRAFFTYISLRDAAQEGALYASYMPGDCAGIIRRVKDTSQSPVDLSTDSNVQIFILIGGTSCAGATPQNGDEVRLTVRYNDFSITTPFLGTLVGRQKLAISASIKDTVLINP